MNNNMLREISLGPTEAEGEGYSSSASSRIQGGRLEEHATTGYVNSSLLESSSSALQEYLLKDKEMPNRWPLPE